MTDNRFQQASSVRREFRAPSGRFRGGLLVPVMAVPVRGNEGGMLSQSLAVEADPIIGRMITPMTLELVSVFAPVQAIDAIKDPAAAYAGMTEVIRQKLLTGNPLFNLENEGEISRRCGVQPRSISGAKRVNEMVRLSYNVAVNYLRRRKFHKAAILTHTNTVLSPAILGSTVLERLNGVLDPDERINGAVQLDLPAMQLPVTGISMTNPGGGTTNPANMTQSGAATSINNSVTGGSVTIQSNIFATLNAQTNAVNIGDFYNAETTDRLIRTMDKIVKDNPEHGQDMVMAWAHGLNVESGDQPWVIAERSITLNQDMVGAVDSAGVTNETRRSDLGGQIGFAVPIPRTELGGIIITFAVVKPDETIATQPHPILSDVWGVDNFVAQTLALDPVPVTFRDLDSECLTAQEGNIAFWTGLNELKRAYVHYGFNRHVTPATMTNKMTIWQLQVPLSVTPSSVLYPATLPHTPFVDQTATYEPFMYSIESNAVFKTPMIFGPTPVETLEIITNNTLLT